MDVRVADHIVVANRLLNEPAGSTGATADVIHDFSSTDGDIINVSGIDAKTGISGGQAFTFVGTDAFDGSTAGQLRSEVIDGNTYVEGDMNGDGVADVMISLIGAYTLTNTDFTL